MKTIKDLPLHEYTSGVKELNRQIKELNRHRRARRHAIARRVFDILLIIAGLALFILFLKAMANLDH